MAKRLSERFTINQLVEVYFAQSGSWLPGQILRFEAPGVWVQTVVDGRIWFVTNGRRIRAYEPHIDEDEADAA